jgi:cellulose synthase/poly-beta-1,6-N-acetylglucosamine synthase-like glycosyltransferase
MKTVTVTIGFCVKNMEETVGKALSSLESQDFPHDLLEIVVVEGFSNDGTFSIVKNHLSKLDIDYRIIRNNDGLGAARQRVVQDARGRYIVWVDGDMILPSDYVRKQVEYMENNNSIAVAAGKYGLHIGQGLVADLENVVYATDSVFGEKSASKFGYLPGSEGSIYRVEAVRQVGGFDPNIKGAAEDTELDYRLLRGGWTLGSADAFFVESTRPNLFSLWHQYFWYGRGGHFIYHKDSNVLKLWKLTPPAGFAAGLLRCSGAYSLTHKKMVFLLPLHYTFKRIAWLLGFIKAHLDDYGH